VSVCCSDGQVKPGGLHQAGVDQRSEGSGGKSKSERRLAISESYICLVSSPDLIRHVDRFQYNAPCVVVRAICTAVGFGSGAETNLCHGFGSGAETNLCHGSLNSEVCSYPSTFTRLCVSCV